MTLESLSDNPPNACYCHSEQSEESHRFKYLHLQDSSTACGGLRMTLSDSLFTPLW